MARAQREPDLAPLLARSARRPDDDVELAGSGAAGEWLCRHTQLLREPERDTVALRWEVHRRLWICEVVGAPHLLDRVAEGADAASDLARVVDVTAAVQHVHGDAPRRREDVCRGLCAFSARARNEEKRCEDGERDHETADHQQARDRIALDRLRGHREAGQLASLAVLETERRRVERGGDQRIVGPREAVHAALFEPAHFLGGYARALRRLLDRQLPMEAGARERRFLAVWLERVNELHTVSHSSFRGGHPSNSSAKSTSPGDSRSSQGTSSAGTPRRPASGTSSQTARPRITGSSSTACLGDPKRVAAPAASTTAVIIFRRLRRDEHAEHDHLLSRVLRGPVAKSPDLLHDG